MVPDLNSRRPPSEEMDRAITLRELGRALRSGAGWVAGFTALAIAAAVAVTIGMRPVYESETLLQFENTESSSSLLGQLSPLSQLGLGSLAGDDDLETQLGVLESRLIAQAVVDSLDLHVQLVAPRIARDSVLRVLAAPQQDFGARYVLTLREDGSYAARVDESERPVAVAATVSVGAPFRLGPATVELLPVAGPRPEQIVVQVQPFIEAVQALQDEITVSPARGATRLVELSYRSPDRVLSAAVPNAIAAVYSDYQFRTSTGDTRQKVQVLRDQVALYARQLRAAEEQLRGYRESAQVIEPETQVSEQVRRLSTVLAERDGRQIERASLQRLLEEVRAGRTRGGASDVHRRLAAFPTFVTNASVQGILQSLIELENERAEMLVLRRPESRDVQGIDARIAELEQQLYNFGTDYLRGLDDQIASANSFLTGFEAELATVPAREVGYVRLMRETELLNEIYTYLQTRLKEAEISEATELGKVRVIDSALSPRHPVSPKPLINVVLAGFIGLTLGTAVAVGRRLTDSRVQGAEEVEAAAGVPVLEVIPAHGNGNGRGGGRLPWRGGVATANGEAGSLAWSGSSPEQYESLLVSLFGAARPRFPAVLLVSSTTANDGRSATVLNLGAALARRGARTVLVDADLRNGSLHRLTGSVAGPGLVEVLRGEVSLESALRPVALPGLPAGSLVLLARGGDRPHAPSDLIGGDELRELLKRLRSEFGAVVVDAPPVNQASDALLLRPLADAMLLVAETGATEKQALYDASRRLRHLEVQGIVLNAPATRGRRLANIRIAPLQERASRS